MDVYTTSRTAPRGEGTPPARGVNMGRRDGASAPRARNGRPRPGPAPAPAPAPVPALPKSKSKSRSNARPPSLADRPLVDRPLVDVPRPDDDAGPGSTITALYLRFDAGTCGAEAGVTTGVFRQPPTAVSGTWKRPSVGPPNADPDFDVDDDHACRPRPLPPAPGVCSVRCAAASAAAAATSPRRPPLSPPPACPRSDRDAEAGPGPPAEPPAP